MVRFINLFEVPAGEEEAVLEFWRGINAYMVAKPGYLGHQLHRSLADDATYRFVNVAEWESAQAWEDAHDEGMWALVKKGTAKYTNVPALYDVIHRGGNLS